MDNSRAGVAQGIIPVSVRAPMSPENPSQSPRRRGITRWLLAIVVLGGVGVFFWKRTPSDPRIDTPMFALEAISGKSLYFNARAHSWLRERRPELLGPDTAAADSERVRAYVRAVQSPGQFRQLDRQLRFDALLLVGNPSEFRPLLDHLVEAKDFRPVYVDHWAIIFRRDTTPTWKIEDLAPLRQKLTGLSAPRMAGFLAETAVRLGAVRRNEEARMLLDEAERLDSKSPAMWNGRALLHAQAGQWKEALACADRALAGKLEPLSAVATKAQALYAMKDFSAAYDLSKELVERVPDDPGILFYHAKIAHDANAFRSEIAVLEKLIALAEAARWPTSGYRIYLGQAYASVSDGARSVAAFEKALADPDLPKEQRDFALENIRRIKSRVGID
jgi:hypothetical protein